MGDLIQPGSRKIEEMAAGNAKEIMGGARLLLHPADMGGIEPGRLYACDDGDMDLDPGRAKPGDRAAAAQYIVVGMGRYDQRPPHILKGDHRADPSMLWRSEEHTSELQSQMRISNSDIRITNKKSTRSDYNKNQLQ